MRSTASERVVANFAEGLATREPFDLPPQLPHELVDEIVLLTDTGSEAAIRLTMILTELGSRYREVFLHAAT